MFTYLVVDPETKKFYVGSGKQKSRAFSHLNGKSQNSRVSEITGNRNVFVFVSDDDGLDTRGEEQFYLDFYFGTSNCLNMNPLANGFPPNHLVNQNRVHNGTHNFLSENRDAEWETKRLEKVKQIVQKRNEEQLEKGTHPFQDLEVRKKSAEASKNFSHRQRRFGQKSRNPEKTSRKMREACERNRGPKQSSDRRKAQRVSHLSRYGFEGLFPTTKEYRTELSSDFINYFSHYGQWQ